jgi:hypothetical protein
VSDRGVAAVAAVAAPWVAAEEAQFQDEPTDACLEEQPEPHRDSGNRGWMDAVVARGPVPSVAVPAGHMAAAVVHLVEARLGSDDRDAPYPGQFAASFFAAHAAARLFVSEVLVALPARFGSAEE